MSKQSLTVFGNEGLFEYILFLHQWCAGVPCLANLFPNGIVAVAELVKHESVQLGDIYLVLFIQHGLVCQYANDLTDDMMTVDLHLVLDDLIYTHAFDKNKKAASQIMQSSLEI